MFFWEEDAQNQKAKTKTPYENSSAKQIESSVKVKQPK